MAAEVVIAPALRQTELSAVRELFMAYARSLDFDLAFQDFEQEMSDFPGKYAPPSGALLLGRIGALNAGAVALRDLGEGRCEMKRLYVRPEARGYALGERLVLRLIEEAKTRGYRAMRLDTVPGHHDHAMALYRRLGFREIAPYCHNPVPGALFMELELS